MNIDKAIEILQIFRDEGDEDLPPDVEPAINLGIEALKRIKAKRPYSNTNHSYKLPGETKV